MGAAPAQGLGLVFSLSQATLQGCSILPQPPVSMGHILTVLGVQSPLLVARTSPCARCQVALCLGVALTQL